jgi:hypothetical protein
MSWTAGEDVTTGQLITAARWNNYMGASGSIEYLKDAVETISQSEVSGSRAIDGTVYHNTSGKIMFVAINIKAPADSGGSVMAYSDSSNPPTTVVFEGSNGCIGDNPTFESVTVLFFVQIGHYYKVSGNAGTSLAHWQEIEIG